MTNEQLQSAQQICKETSNIRRTIDSINGNQDYAGKGIIDEYIAELLPPGMTEVFRDAVLVELNKRLDQIELEFEAL